MTEKVRNYMGMAIILALLIFSFSAWGYVRSYSKSIQPSSFRSFSVSGEGKYTAIPDVAQFTFSILTQGGKNLADLQKENTKKANEAISFIKSNGVEDKDIKTQNYSLEPRYQYYNCPSPSLRLEISPCPPPDIIGYTITQSVQVKIRDFNKIGDILSGVVEKGANSVSQLFFTIDDPTKAQGEARAEAIIKAKEKAEMIAEAGEFRIGRLLSIEEGYSPRPYYDMYSMKAVGMGGAAEAAPAPSIEPGSQDVNVTVTLRYEIE